MTRNQILLCVVIVVLLLGMMALAALYVSSLVDVLTPHPTWTGWMTPTREGTFTP